MAVIFYNMSGKFVAKKKKKEEIRGKIELLAEHVYVIQLYTSNNTHLNKGGRKETNQQNKINNNNNIVSKRK